MQVKALAQIALSQDTGLARVLSKLPKVSSVMGGCLDSIDPPPNTYDDGLSSQIKGIKACIRGGSCRNGPGALAWGFSSRLGACWKCIDFIDTQRSACVIHSSAVSSLLRKPRQ